MEQHISFKVNGAQHELNQGNVRSEMASVKLGLVVPSHSSTPLQTCPGGAAP